ncbi:hypothetical protein PV325_006702 [Microctonus aethiopoides]|nr:hypothetical protein PV325_006702 [Microctonus aethiopoides]
MTYYDIISPLVIHDLRLTGATRRSERRREAVTDSETLLYVTKPESIFLYTSRLVDFQEPAYSYSKEPLSGYVTQTSTKANCEQKANGIKNCSGIGIIMLNAFYTSRVFMRTAAIDNVPK